MEVANLETSSRHQAIQRILHFECEAQKYVQHYELEAEKLRNQSLVQENQVSTMNRQKHLVSNLGGSKKADSHDTKPALNDTKTGGNDTFHSQTKWRKHINRPQSTGFVRLFLLYSPTNLSLQKNIPLSLTVVRNRAAIDEPYRRP